MGIFLRPRPPARRLDGSKVKAKDLYIYLADSKFLANHPAPLDQDAEQSALQRAFVAEILKSGKHYNTFETLDHLCRLALRAGVQVRDPDFKPANLPFNSLGSLFKGREPFLADLRRRFTDSADQACVIVATHGLGGVGKRATSQSLGSEETKWSMGSDGEGGQPRLTGSR